MPQLRRHLAASDSHEAMKLKLNASATPFRPSGGIKKSKVPNFTPKPTKVELPSSPAATPAGTEPTGHLSGVKLVRCKSDRGRLLNLAQDLLLEGLPLKRSAASELSLTLGLLDGSS